VIRDLTLAHDAAGFPVVSWSEHRSAGSVAGPGTQKIECRIVKDASTGILLLCFRGRTRGRPFEFARPWERLAAFAFTSAVHRHESPAEHRQRELLVRKPHLKALWGDGGQALYADFAGSVTVDVSCPEISQVEQEQLHYLLEREFVSLRNDYVAARQLEGFRWPINNDQIEAVAFFFPPGANPRTYNLSGPDTYDNQQENNIEVKLTQQLLKETEYLPAVNFLIGYNRASWDVQVQNLNGEITGPISSGQPGFNLAQTIYTRSPPTRSTAREATT